MVKRKKHQGRSIFAARAMRRPLRAMQEELEGVLRNQDIECVHRMRVASRRLRNAVSVFEEELARVADKRWRKRLKYVTKRLGSARDLDVQIDFLGQFRGGLGEAASMIRPGIEHVLQSLVQRRQAAQVEVTRALDRLESNQALPRLQRWIERQLNNAEEGPADEGDLRGGAGLVVNERLAELLSYEPYVEQPHAVKELHAMRIAAKHLRYTLELFAPLYPDDLKSHIQHARWLQDWLGEIHDCDVWEEQLSVMLSEPATADQLTPGLECLRDERRRRRAEVYGEFVAAWHQATATDYWGKFRRLFEPAATTAGSVDDLHGATADVDRSVPGEDSGASLSAGCASRDGPMTYEQFSRDERLRPVFDLAQVCAYEAGHTHHVTHLALRFFDESSALHGLDGDRRFWLTCAALLHDIGWVEGRPRHQKTALRLILQSPMLPWDERMRRIVGLIARYHRRALPKARHRQFAALPDADQADVRTLSAILRIADALDFTHENVVSDLTCRFDSKRLDISCTVTRPADKECERAVRKGRLAADVFNREVRVTWRLREASRADQ